MSTWLPPPKFKNFERQLEIQICTPSTILKPLLLDATPHKLGETRGTPAASSGLAVAEAPEDSDGRPAAGSVATAVPLTKESIYSKAKA